MKRSYISTLFALTIFTFSPILCDVIEIESIEQYQKLIDGNKPVVLKFSAEWCGACQSIKQQFNEASNEQAARGIAFANVNIDKFQALSKNNDIVGVPTFLYVEKSAVKNKEVGVKNPETFKADLLSSASKYFSLSQHMDAVQTEVQKSAPISTETQPTTEPVAAHAIQEQAAGQAQAVAEVAPAPTQEQAAPGTQSPSLVEKIKAFLLWLISQIKNVVNAVIEGVKGLFSKK